MAHGSAELAVGSTEAAPVTRIALVSPYALDVPGGVQDQVMGLAEQLDRRGFDTVIVGPRADRTGVGSILRIPANGAVAPISLSPGVWGRVRSALIGADVVHIHEPFMPLVGWAALTSSAPHTVGTFHADPSRLIRAAYRSLRPRRLLRNLSAVSAVSSTAASAVDWLTDVSIIPNGVRSNAATIERVPKQVAFLGRDDPRKGLALLLDAWPAVAARHPDARLIVMGSDGQDSPGLSFLGRVDEATKESVLASSGVFCAPNLGGESFGITVAEAMSAGCAVVASGLPAFRDVLGEAGRFFPPGDRHELAAQLGDLLSDPLEGIRLGEQGLGRAADFAWDHVTDRYLELYGIDSAK